MKIWQTSCTRLREHPAAAAAGLAAVTLALAAASLLLGAAELSPRRSSGRAGRARPEQRGRAGGAVCAAAARFAAACWPGRRWPRPGSSSRPCWRTRWPRRISSASTPGPGLAVTLCCALAPAAALQPLAAFAGAMAGVGLVLVFAEATGASRMTLVLAGVAISNLFTALIDAVTTIFPDALLGYADFRMGGLAGVTMGPAGACGRCLIGASLALAVSLAGLLEILSLGPETAQSLGVAVRPVRLLFLALAAALAGSAVSVLRAGRLCRPAGPACGARRVWRRKPPPARLLRPGRGGVFDAVRPDRPRGGCTV